MAAKDRKHYAKVKADPIAYAEYRARKNREAKARGWDRERHAIGKRKWRANNPVKAQTLRRAHHAVEEAVKRGRLKRASTCSECGGG